MASRLEDSSRKESASHSPGKGGSCQVWMGDPSKVSFVTSLASLPRGLDLFKFSSVRRLQGEGDSVQDKQSTQSSLYHLAKRLCLYKGQLEHYMDVDFIVSTFEQMGVRLNSVCRLRKYGAPAKFAFLELADPSQLDWVLSLNNWPIPHCPTKRFVLNHAGSKYSSKAVEQNNDIPYVYSVFVAGFSRTKVDDQKLFEVFSTRYPSTTGAHVGLDKWGRHKNYGFVQMSDMAERICCIEQMNGQVVEELGHKPITVKPASTDTTYSHVPSGPMMPAITPDTSQAPSTPTDQSNHLHTEPESDSDDEEVDPNPPEKFEELNKEYFSRDQELFLSMEHCQWQPFLSLNSKLNSKKIKTALEAASHWSQ